MLSVIVPTLWEVPGFKYFINVVAEVSSVKEILIFDNASHLNYTSNNTQFFCHSKIKVIPLSSNLGVNPIWNIGSLLAKAEHLLFLNDDVFFDVSILNKVDLKLFNDPTIGLICPATARLYGAQVSSNDIVFELAEGDIHLGAGTMLFMHKHKFREIPKELKIFWGDTYLWNILKLEGYRHFKISNYPYFTIGGETTCAIQLRNELDPVPLCEQEGQIYYKKYHTKLT